MKPAITKSAMYFTLNSIYGQAIVFLDEVGNELKYIDSIYLIIDLVTEAYCYIKSRDDTIEILANLPEIEDNSSNLDSNIEYSMQETNYRITEYLSINNINKTIERIDKAFLNYCLLQNEVINFDLTTDDTDLDKIDNTRLYTRLILSKYIEYNNIKALKVEELELPPIGD